MKRLDIDLLHSLFDNTSDGIYVIDPATSLIVGANKAACTNLQMTEEEIIAKTIIQVNSDVSGMYQWQGIADSIRSTGAYRFVGHHKRKDNTEFPVEVTTNFLIHEGKEYFVSIVRDITHREKTTNSLKENEFLRTFILNEASDGVWDWNLEDDSLFLSSPWYRMFGYGPDEITNPTSELWVNALHPEDSERVIELMDNHLQGKSKKFEAKYRLKTRQGDYIWVHDRGMVASFDADGKPTRIIGMVLDIDESQKHSEQMRYHADYDHLTQLHNRRTGYDMFQQHLEQCQMTGQPLQVIMLDLDNFKSINDQHGHLNGDKAIKLFAETLKQKLRQTDMFCRWGGEEFLLLLPNMEQKNARTLIHRTLQELESKKLRVEDGTDIYITASAGMSSYPQDGNELETLVKAADIAMYEAKAAGKNRVVTQTELKDTTQH